MKLIVLLNFAALAAASALSAINATFSDCLSRTITSPRFTAQEVDIIFDQSTRLLSYEIRGNMVGTVNDTSADNTLASALTNSVTVAGVTQRKFQDRLCSVARNPVTGSNNASYCPFGPGETLVQFDTQLDASYVFASLTSTIRINAPIERDYEVGCIEVTITPPLSSQINNILTYVPLMVLILIGVKVVSVIILNPWSGTLDPFRGFSHFGMDVNALRMATPGFSDCLGYLQFIAISSMLDLKYPGFFQPVTSRIGWAMLIFPNSPISSPANYVPQTSQNLATWVNFVGVRGQDAWKSFMIWWLILQACTVALVSLILLLWWSITPSATELTRKNIPFLGGSMLRSYYWFLVPISVFTSYQLLVASFAPAAVVVLAAIVFIFFVVVGPSSLLVFLPRHKPRQDLYDDLAILNFVGPVYNTLTERALSFFAVQIVLTVLRGIVVGFLQTHGTAQLVLLIVFEALTIASLFRLRPWPSRTNTTLVSIAVSIVKLVILLLTIPFVASLPISAGKREVVGYVILFIHAAVLVVVYLGNALLTILELIIRLLVIVPQDDGAGAIFGARQLRLRRGRKASADPRTVAPQSMASASSVTGLLSDKEESPFFRTPRPNSRFSRGADSPSGDFRSRSSMSDLMRSPSEYTLGDYSTSGKVPLARTHSFASQEILTTTTKPYSVAMDTPSLQTPLAMAPTEDAARRGVDYAVREADVYHPQSSGELLGPSKKLGTGPADPNGVVFRKIKWAPWRKERNTEKGKFVVVRSTPAPDRSSVHAPVAMQQLAAEPESNHYPLSPQYESIQEEDEEPDHSYFPNSPRRSEDLLQHHGLRHVVNDGAPVLPTLQIPSAKIDGMSDIDLTSPMSLRSMSDDGLPLHSPPAPVHDRKYSSSRVSEHTTNSVRSVPIRASIRGTFLPTAHSAQIFGQGSPRYTELNAADDRHHF